MPPPRTISTPAGTSRAEAAASPDVLELSLDASSYAPGDTAMVRLVPRQAGKALITVLSDRLVRCRRPR